MPDDANTPKPAFGPRSMLRVMDILQPPAVEPQMLAFLPKSFQTKYLAQTKFVKFTEDTSSKEELIALFPDIRRRGVVVDANGIIDGATGIASPCFDEAGLVNCSVTIAGPTSRML